MSIVDNNVDSTSSVEEVLRVSPAAFEKVQEVRSAEADGDSLGLRVEITGIDGPEFRYDLSLEPVADALATDHVRETNGLVVMVPADSVDNMRGATLDVPSNPAQGGLVIKNPRRPDPLAGLDLELTGDVAEKVQQLLDAQINPSLAAHGGFATLVGVEDGRVFVTMGGGCQGCSMSQATLTEGIQRTIREAIPEVSEVVDATDHTAGDNPFYS